MFWRKKELSSREYELLSAKIVEIATNLSILKADMERVDSRLATFNHRLNRKLKEIENEEEQEETSMSPAELQRALLGMGGNE